MYKTCRTPCVFFDSNTGECGIYQNINPDDPLTIYTCSDFLSSELEPSVEDHHLRYYKENTLLLQGEIYENEKSTYPVEPDFDSYRRDALWYVSPDKSFGCWIVNNYSRRFYLVNEGMNTNESQDKEVYNSPFPLHNHNAPTSIASKMCWYINKDGVGQYVLLIKGEIEKLPFFSNPFNNDEN